MSVAVADFLAAFDANVVRLAAAPPPLVPAFRMADGRAHVTEQGGHQFSLCGVETGITAPPNAVPCPTCFALAGERLAAQS